MLFIFDKFKIHTMKFVESIYERIFAINKIDDQCQIYREIFEQKFISIKRVNLKRCNKKKIFCIMIIDYECSLICRY